MKASAVSRLVRMVLSAALAATALVGISSAASAGGWAVASLESMPTPQPGTTTEVEFTILQHGVTPAELDEGVGIEITDPDGGTSFFPAISNGQVGHYVATVTFPDVPGTYEWRVQMGWFGPHELGAMDVEAAATTGWGWSTVRWMALGASLVLAAVAAIDFAASRRRHLAVG